MQITPKTGAFEAIVLGLSEQSHRHQSAIARFADRALSEIDLDPILFEACQLCAEVLEVPAVRVLEFRDENGLAMRCAVRRDSAVPDAEAWTINGIAGRINGATGFAAGHGGIGLAGTCMMPGTLKQRVLSSVSAVIDDGVERFGLLELDRAYAREFSELEVDFVTAIARLLGRAVARNREREAMRLANDALAMQVEETRTLLRELSHRVRNDLQMLEAQCGLCARAAAEPTSRAGFTAIGRRVMALAALYDHLLISTEPRLVAFDDYLSTLCIRVQDAHDLTGSGVTLEVSTRPVWLVLEHAGGFGIAVNELIANAAEHAFAGRDTGRIRLELAPGPAGSHTASLTVGDDGPGARGPEGDGLTLARRLIVQHGGTLTREPGPGTVWRISFPCV